MIFAVRINETGALSAYAFRKGGSPGQIPDNMGTLVPEGEATATEASFTYDGETGNKFALVTAKFALSDGKAITLQANGITMAYEDGSREKIADKTDQLSWLQGTDSA